MSETPASQAGSLTKTDSKTTRTRREYDTERSLHGLLDSLFAGAATFGFAVAAQQAIADLQPHEGTQPVINPWTLLWTLGPAIMAALYVLDDWITARPLLDSYPYTATFWTVRARLWIDVAIMGVAFLWIAAAMALSAAWYLAFAATTFALGGVWAIATQREYGGSQDAELRVMVICHVVVASVLTVATLFVMLFDWLIAKSASNIPLWEPIKRGMAMGLPMVNLAVYKFVAALAQQKGQKPQ